MTSRIAVAVFLLCPLAAGCGLFRIGARNLFNEAKLVRDNRLEQIRYACLAHEAWENVKASCPLQSYSTDYAAGFHAGFADYLYAGGCGEPPALPPKRYRHFHAESPGGAKALQDWYEGFRHGAAVAKESGLRQFVIVSLPPPAAPQLSPPSVPILAPPSAPPSPLPMPRTAPQDTPAEAAPNGMPETPKREASPPSNRDAGSSEEQP